MGEPSAQFRATQMKVLMPGSSEKLRISDELAECFDFGDGGAGMTAFLVSPFGTAIWHVGVGRDGDGAFLGRRWPEFVEAHGLSVGWFLVLRHEGRGVLTLKAFDGTYVIREFGQTLTVPGNPAAQIETGRARRPQFIMPLCPDSDWMTKMPIPAEFLKRRFISDEELNRKRVTFVTPSRDFCHIDLEKDGSNVFFAGDWSKFLEFQGIVKGEALLIRYQGNMVFTLEVFGFCGCRKKLDKIAKFQQTANSEEIISYHKTEQKKDSDSYQETEQSSEEAQSSQKEADIRRVDEIQSELSVTKEISNYAIERYISLPMWFSKEIGLQETCKIALKSSGYQRSWDVTFFVEKRGQCNLTGGWKMFCKDLRLKKGDVCTFNVIKRRLWHVDVERC